MNDLRMAAPRAGSRLSVRKLAPAIGAEVLGDLLIWDNRCTLHARKDFPATHLRKLRRVAVKGDQPV